MNSITLNIPSVVAINSYNKSGGCFEFEQRDGDHRALLFAYSVNPQLRVAVAAIETEGGYLFDKMGWRRIHE